MSHEKHKPGKDGLLQDGVSTYPASPAELQSYALAAQELKKLQTPLLLNSSNPHQRIFIASFDGTGNDATNDPFHATNVAKINNYLRALGDDRIHSGYVAGPGTQSGFVSRTWDGATGASYDERLEAMYTQLVAKAKEWKTQDPDAEISIANIGFSRGAVQAAGFARLVHERGIVDPDSKIVRIDEHGRQFVEYTAYLVPPGQTPQVEGLFDPVNTGLPEDRDRRPPPSVISGFQIIALDERRAKFKSDRIIDPGMTPDGRFLGVTVAGAHSDIGGSYHRDGLAVRNGNLMIDYLNALSDKPFLQKSVEPDDPRLNVVHRSEEGMLIYRIDKKIDRSKEEGYGVLLVPKDQIKLVPDAYNAEPRDETLARQFTWQPVAIGAQTQGLREPGNDPITVKRASGDMFESLYQAAQNRDDAGARQVAQDYTQSDAGRAFLAQGQQANAETRAQTQAAQQAQAQPEESPAQRGPAMGR